MAKKIDKQERVNDILLGPLERPALKWLSAHMPPWVNPDTLTIIGLIGTAITVIGYVMAGKGEIKHNGFLWLASLGFVINWFGDSLDGNVARYRHIERPRYGYFIDHSVDAITSTAIFLALGLSKLVPFELGAMAAIGYLLAMLNVHMKTYVTGIFEMTSMKLGPTEIRLIAIIANTLVYFFGNPELSLPILGQVSIFTLILGFITFVLLFYFILKTIKDGTKLALLDGKRLERRLKREAEMKNGNGDKKKKKAKKADMKEN